MESELFGQLPRTAGKIAPHGLQQGIGADDICLDEIRGTVDRAVDMAFGRQVHDGARPMGVEDRPQGLRLGNAGFDEPIPRVLFELREGIEICCVS